jgi:hypothetical protein
VFRSYLSLAITFNFIHFRKIHQCERSEPLFPNEVVLQFEEVVEIEVNCKIEEEVIWALGWDFRVDFGVHFWAEFYPLFWAPFLTLFWTFLGLGFACFTGLFRFRSRF